MKDAPQLCDCVIFISGPMENWDLVGAGREQKLQGAHEHSLEFSRKEEEDRMAS